LIPVRTINLPGVQTRVTIRPERPDDFGKEEGKKSEIDADEETPLLEAPIQEILEPPVQEVVEPPIPEEVKVPEEIKVPEGVRPMG